MDELDLKYGPLRDPERVDKWEDRPPASLSRLDAKTAAALVQLEECSQSDLLRHAARTTNYIWAIDFEGDIRIAVEEIAIQPLEAPLAGYPRRRGYQHPSEDKKLGHPTLLGGGKARIAGELALDDFGGELRWVVNANSGRYCRQQPPSRMQLESVAADFQQFGILVEIDEI